MNEQPEFGAGSLFTSFVIPKVCPTVDHVESDDYVNHIQQIIDFKNKIKKSMKKDAEIKNVFRDQR